MPETKRRSLLAVEHQELKRQTEELGVEHQRLRRDGGTRAEHDAHRLRLRHKRIELEAHYTRLRQIAEERQLRRQAAIADEERDRPPPK